MLPNLTLNVPVLNLTCIPQDLNGRCIMWGMKPFVKVHVYKQRGKAEYLSLPFLFVS